MGETYRQIRVFEQARSHLQQALAVRRDLGDRQGEAKALLSLGQVLLETRELAAARDAWRLAHDILEALGDPEVIEAAALLRGLGDFNPGAVPGPNNRLSSTY